LVKRTWGKKRKVTNPPVNSDYGEVKKNGGEKSRKGSRPGGNHQTLLIEKKGRKILRSKQVGTSPKRTFLTRVRKDQRQEGNKKKKNGEIFP